MTHPTHGFTKAGHAVHGKTIDHHPTETAYQRLNKRVALGLTKYIFTMTAFWVFCLLAFCSLPAILSGFALFHGVFPHWMITASLISLIAWISSNFLQLVLLPALGVGQSLQSVAADARAAKQFEDTEFIMNQVNTETQGGLRTVLDRLDQIDAKIASRRK